MLTGFRQLTSVKYSNAQSKGYTVKEEFYKAKSLQLGGGRRRFPA
jgi:hypothetical protein